MTKQERNRRDYLLHRAKRLEYRRIYYETHRPEVQAYSKNRRAMLQECKDTLDMIIGDET